MTARAPEVVIVGAGPTGLTLALLLARRGVEVLLAEKEEGAYPLPRAAHIDHQVVRIFQELGLAETILEGCRRAERYDFLNAAGEVLLRIGGADRIGPGGWPAANMIHQPTIEEALRTAAAAEPRLRLEAGWRLAGVEPSGDGVLALFETPGGKEHVLSSFLVGADGARSATRSLVGGDLDDLGFDEPWLVVDTLVLDPDRLPTANLQICNPERPTTSVLMGRGRHRWEFMIKPGETPASFLEAGAAEALLEPWGVGGAVEIERTAVYRFHARIARTWRTGPVLLAGDAAHQMPPFAGQGLCSGVRDAANLAWKIAAVLAGDAGEALLDTYQVEREPNVRAIIDMAIAMGRTVCITDPAAAAVRDAQMLAARAAGGPSGGAPSYPDLLAGHILKTAAAAGDYFAQPVCGSGARLDDVLGPGPWLISREPAAARPRGLVLACLSEARLAPFAAALEAWLDAHKAPAVLVRPDRYVFGTGTCEDLIAGFRPPWGDAPQAL